MPHSAGGGSHSGGSHHSSSHSSHGGSGGSGTRVSRTYFFGAKKYSYYNRHGVQEYVYSDRDLTKAPSKARYLVLLFYIPFFWFIFMMYGEMVRNPKPLKMDYDKQIVIEDHLHILDEDILMNSLVSFQEKTGITPSVMTVYDGAWDDDYNFMEDYAYSLYVDTFSDEKHFLVVYSEPSRNYFNHWSFECIQGDDTDPLITKKIADQFVDSLTGYLNDKNVPNPTMAIIDAFDEMNEVIMEKSVDKLLLPFGVMMTTFVAYNCYFIVFHNPDKKYRNATLVPMDKVSNSLDALEQRLAHIGQPAQKREVACKYCGSVFMEGERDLCPYCGGELEYKDTSTEKREYYKEV